MTRRFASPSLQDIVATRKRHLRKSRFYGPPHRRGNARNSLEVKGGCGRLSFRRFVQKMPDCTVV